MLAVIYDTLRRTGAWVKAQSDDAASRLSTHWGIDPAIIAEANKRRSYKVGPVQRDQLAEQQRIADAFFAEGLLPRAVDAAAARIWSPPS